MISKIFSLESFLAIFRSTLAKNVSVVGLSSIALRIVGFIFTAIVARAINPDGFAEVILFIALLTTFSQFFDLGLSTTYLKKSGLKNEVFRKLFVYSKVLIHIISLPLIYLLLVSLNDFISITKSHIALLILAYFSQSILNLMQTYFQSLNMFYHYSLIPLISNVIKLVLLYFLFRLEIFNIDYVLLVITVSPFIASVFFLPRIYFDTLNIPEKIKPHHLLEVFVTAKWIALSAVATIVTMKLDIFFLAYFSPDRELGLYGVANQFASAISLLSMSLTAVLLPRFSGSDDKNLLNNFKNTILLMFFPMLLICLISYPLIDFFIVLMFGAEYELSSIPAKILVSGALISLLANQLGILYLANNKPQILTKINFMQMIVMFIACYYLVPIFGGIGAALSMLLIRLLMVIYMISDLKNS